MNNHLFRIVLLLVLYTCIRPLQAQTLSSELNKVREAYSKSKNLSFNVEVYSYTTKTDKTAELVSKGYMKKNDEKYYSNFDNYELMINAEKALIVDRSRKILDYYEYKTGKPEMNEGYNVNIDSLLSGTDSIIIRPMQNGLKQFTCFSKNGYVRQTEIFVDAQTNFINRILYYYVASTEDFKIEFDRVEIFYQNIQTKVIDQSYFSFEKYFKRTKSTLTPVGDYRGYKINYHNSKH